MANSRTEVGTIEYDSEIASLLENKEFLQKQKQLIGMTIYQRDTEVT
jgi:hypothetical protein